MRLAITALLVAPCIAQATLIEYTGTGKLTYHWEDQSNHTGTVTVLADEDSIHSLVISNGKTQLTYENPDVSWLYSYNMGRWMGSFRPKDHVADFAPVEGPFHAQIIWDIVGPESLNPYLHLDGLRDIFIATDYREFEFQPTTWTQKVVGAVSVPEPGSMALLGAGLLGLWGTRRHYG